MQIISSLRARRLSPRRSIDGAHRIFARFTRRALHLARLDRILSRLSLERGRDVIRTDVVAVQGHEHPR
ncbi:MAG: hypothetical protein M3Q61_04930, partial [Chloroflexota bacterium]|nr:hypothetical protein [Chloroflexota bacterium]